MERARARTAGVFLPEPISTERAGAPPIISPLQNAPESGDFCEISVGAADDFPLTTRTASVPRECRCARAPSRSRAQPSDRAKVGKYVFYNYINQRGRW